VRRACVRVTPRERFFVRGPSRRGAAAVERWSAGRALAARRRVRRRVQACLPPRTSTACRRAFRPLHAAACADRRSTHSAAVAGAPLRRVGRAARAHRACSDGPTPAPSAVLEPPPRRRVRACPHIHCCVRVPVLLWRFGRRSPPQAACARAHGPGGPHGGGLFVPSARHAALTWASRACRGRVCRARSSPLARVMTFSPLPHDERACNMPRAAAPRSKPGTVAAPSRPRGTAAAARRALRPAARCSWQRTEALARPCRRRTAPRRTAAD
jgi:hypothetical protein